MKPIIFNSEMIRAIQEGRKTQTRRVIKPQPTANMGYAVGRHKSGHIVYLRNDDGKKIKVPYGIPGDTLWVRETFFYEWPDDQPPDDYKECKIIYRASEPDYITWDKSEGLGNWSPSIHMPRWAARIFLEITKVRVERVQDISEEDAIAEGITSYDDVHWVNYGKGQPDLAYPSQSFQSLWDSINAKRGYSWESNPYCWVVDFKQTEEIEK